MTLSCCLVKGKLICENRGRIIRGITIHKGKKQSFHISREKLTHSRSSPWPLVEMHVYASVYADASRDPSRIYRITNTTVTCFTCHGITRPMFIGINGGSKMAPMFRTCCGFLQIQAAYKVGNPRLCIKTGLNAGAKCLYRLPAIQVREFNGISHITTRYYTGQVMIFSLSHQMYYLRDCIKLYVSVIT